MKKLLTICLMLLGVVAQAQNFAITATTEAAIRKNIVKGNASNYGFGMINDTLKLVGLTTRNVIFTGTIGKSGVGLGNVDNTSDANKPVSTATQTALNLKANLASPTFTGTVSGITKSMVGLGNVDNTSDASKAISTATQTALDAKQATLSGTGFVKSTAGTISYDNSTYLTSSTASSTYLPISNPTATGTLTAPTISNTLGANFATSSGNVGIGTTSLVAKLTVVGSDNNISMDAGASGNPYLDFQQNGVQRAYLQYVNTGAYVRLVEAGLVGLVQKSGNIGIGTTTPSQKLNIAGAGYVAALIQTSTYTAGASCYFSNATRSFSIGARGDYGSTGQFNLVDETIGVLRLSVSTAGNVLIGSSASDAGYKLDVQGTARANQFYLSALNTAPASATATGTTGEIRIDASYIYICTATNTWKRSAITTW
jgi:hypothetical protein